MSAFNVFRILGDLTHLTSKLVLIWSIHSNRSAEGVSLITQVLYAVVFCTRYLDLFQPAAYAKETFSAWNLVFKLVYIATSLYIVYVMLRVFARSREREKAWKFGAACLASSLLSSPFVMMIFLKQKYWGFLTFTRAFSEILESICVLPQLMLLRQSNIPTVIDSFYLVLLGSYRIFYILNWIYRGISGDSLNPIDVTFGVIQVLFYLDFAWVYWTRQRVKLRNGTVVDQDDMSRGYLVGKFLGGRRSVDADGENGDETEGNNRGWAGRGISISADETTVGHRPTPQRFNNTASQSEERSSMMHGEQEEVEFEDEEPDARGKKVAHDSGITGGEEWRSGDDHE